MAKPKLSTTDLRVAMGWIRDYCDPATAPKTPEEMKALVEDMYEVEVTNIQDIEEYFNEKYDYDTYMEEKAEYSFNDL
jgi:hypothetical protein